MKLIPLLFCLSYFIESIAAELRLLPYPPSRFLAVARAHHDRVLERAAWEFFSGAATEPAWTKDEAAAKPVFRDPGHVGHSDMTYVPHMPAKWLDADGLGGWMLYSGDWR